MRSATLLAIPVVLATSTLACWLGGIRVNLTGSMPIGAYRVVQGQPSRGAMVLACIPTSIARFAHERGYVPNGNCPGGVAAVGKRIVALSGDTVILTVEGIRIAGSVLPNSKPLRRDSDGRPLPQLALGIYVLRPDEMWLLSTYSERSFDSRYFGPVPTTAIVAIMTPLLAPP